MFTLWLAIFLTVIGVGLIAFFCACLTSPVQWDDAMAERYTLPATDFYLDQSRKSLAFAVGCLTVPPILALSFFLSQRLTEKMGDSSLRLMTIAGGIVTWLFFFWCLLPLFYCPNPPYPRVPPSFLLYGWFFKAHLFTNQVRFYYLLVIVGFGLLFWLRSSSSKNLNRTLAVLILMWAVASPAHFYAPVEVEDDWRFTYHLNAIMDALGQSAGGHHYLVDFPDIYGGYAEILGFILRLLPRAIGTPLFIFGLLSVVSVLGLLVTARLVIRQPLLLFLTGLALLGTEYLVTILDHYYQYYALRMIFPSLGLVSAALYLRHPRPFAYATATTIAAFASIWNLDTGFVLWLSWTATLAAMGWSTGGWMTSLRYVVIQTAALCATWAIFFLYLWLASGQLPDPAELFIFQTMWAKSGYLCIGLVFPDAWVIVLALYITGLAVAFVFYAQGKPSWKTHFILMLSLMGIGLFDYFMGRSAESNFVDILYPAFLLIGLLLSETWTLTLLRKLPQTAWLLLSPAALLLLWWAYLFAWAGPEQLVRSIDVVLKWQGGAPSPLDGNFAFVKQRTLPHERVYMLSRQSGFCYYLTDTTCPIKIPGPEELLWNEDIEKLSSALRSDSLPKLFVDQDFFDENSYYKTEVYQELKQLISEHYRPESTSPSGRVILYVPR